MFKDRAEAGKQLVEALAEYKRKNVIVLALPRGGVPVGFEVAHALECPLDTIVARKVGAPGDPEYAVGAIAPYDVLILEERMSGIDRVIEEEKREMQRRMQKYKSGAYTRDARPDAVIIVDDGVATGKTARAAVRAARAMYPAAEIIFAVPVGAPDSLEEIRREADVFCLEAPQAFLAVGEWYEAFPQLRDEEVIELLETSSQ